MLTFRHPQTCIQLNTLAHLHPLSATATCTHLSEDPLAHTHVLSQLEDGRPRGVVAHTGGRQQVHEHQVTLGSILHSVMHHVVIPVLQAGRADREEAP